MTKGAEGRQAVVASERRRSIRSHQAILAATTQLLAEVGYSALTIEGVATRAGVGKATVYRWWPSKGALVIEAMSTGLGMIPVAETGDLRQDLLAVGKGIVQTLARTPAGAVIPALAADLMRDPDMAEQFRSQIIRPRRSAIKQLLHHAVDRGKLPADLDIDLLIDVYAGTVFYRVLVSGEPVTDRLAEQLVGLLLDGNPPVKPSGAA
jgi:AcrR family transcriptional regulator